MRIEVWSDVVCPWCWVGHTRLDKAVAAFAHAADVEIVNHSFELDPATPKDLDISTNELLQKKFGVGPTQLEGMHERLRSLGQAEGIEFRFERVRTANTFDAHQLVHLAGAHGKAQAMTGRLFRANFSEGVRVADRKELARLAVEVGLDGAEVEEALGDQRFASAVRDDEKQAKTLGISGVPFFLADGKLAVSGAQPVEVLGRMLDAAWEKRAAG
jgi:predicted DsbA family dithiol-disulfide isomerase